MQAAAIRPCPKWNAGYFSHFVRSNDSSAGQPPRRILWRECAVSIENTGENAVPDNLCLMQKGQAQ
jgi:hypothetical protein